MAGNPVVDQTMATLKETQRVCGVNRHVVHDFKLEPIVLRSMGQVTEMEKFSSDHLGPRPRVVPANRDLAAMTLDEFQMANPRLHGVCDRCASGARSEARVLLPAGATIVSVEVCASCKDFLDDKFGPVTWQN